tara:strand:+ start:35 stop:562 length:528 start_codon:yes stop_codon:yes gene_type:complete
MRYLPNQYINPALTIRDRETNIAQLSREERQEKLKQHEAARDKVPEGKLDPPEEVSDEMIQEGLQKKDVEEGNYLRDPENYENLMNLVKTGFSTYNSLKQIPVQVIRSLLLRGLLGQKSLAQGNNDMKIAGLPHTPPIEKMVVGNKLENSPLRFRSDADRIRLMEDFAKYDRIRT